MIENDIVDPVQLAAVQKGRAYSVLERSEGYRNLLEFLDKRTTFLLEQLGECEDGDDRKKLDAMMVWRESVRLSGDIRAEVQRGIESGREALKNMQVDSPEEASVFGFGDPEV